MKYNDMLNMSNEELQEISLKKQTKGPQKGCATADALKAQEILYIRAGEPFQSKGHNERDHLGIRKW